MLASLCHHYRVTLLAAGLALLAFACPALSPWWELDFAAVATGQWWRLFTGHLTHYDGQHLFWDLLMFVVLGAVCERQHRRSYLLAVGLMAAGISVALGVCCQEISVYRGLSGLDTGLFMWFIADQCRHHRQQGDVKGLVPWLLPGVGLLGKLAYEATTGQTLFVDSAEFSPLVEAHLAGAAGGFIAGWALRPTPTQSSLPDELAEASSSFCTYRVCVGKANSASTASNR